MKTKRSLSRGMIRKPFLQGIQTIGDKLDSRRYPFSIPAFSHGINIDITANVTLFVGENGSGKSTLLEAIANKCGFNAEGGSRNHQYRTQGHSEDLASALRLSWFPKVTRGFFFRAESFFNFASYIDQLANGDERLYQSYGGKSLHAQSHGESFLSLFANRFDNGIYIIDEPEAALSPQRQLAFLKIIHDLEIAGRAQFLVATHSPMILAYPGAVIFTLDGNEIHQVSYQDTDHFQLMKAFMESPERYFNYLFSPVDEDD